MSARVLYVTYDGLDDSLGQSQIIPYLRGLQTLGFDFEVLSFEKTQQTWLSRAAMAPGLVSTRFRYHKKPLISATAFDMTQGALGGWVLALLCRVDVVHVRSLVAATMMLPACATLGRPMIFDMRGLWIDERIESGQWASNHPIPMIARRLEKVLLHRSTEIVVLTHSMKTLLITRHGPQIAERIHVIPTCVDLELFDYEVEPDPEICSHFRTKRVLVYLGSMERRYRMADIVMFYRNWKSALSDTALLVVSRSDGSDLHGTLRAHGLEQDLMHVSVERSRIPSVLRCASAGVFSYRQGLSTRGTAPTRLGELLACGLPVAGNAVGDVAQILNGKVGVVLPDVLTEHQAREKAGALASLATHEATRRSCRAAAETHFSLESGIRRYAAAYSSALAR